MRRIFLSAATSEPAASNNVTARSFFISPDRFQIETTPPHPIPLPRWGRGCPKAETFRKPAPCELPMTGSARRQRASLLQLPAAARKRGHPRHNLADVARARPASAARLLPADKRRETKFHARQSVESLTVASYLPPHPGPLPQGEGTGLVRLS